MPIVIIRAAEQDTNVQFDIDQIRRYQFAVDDRAGSNVHLPSPLAHVPVRLVAMLWIIKTDPSSREECEIGRLPPEAPRGKNRTSRRATERPSS